MVIFEWFERVSQVLAPDENYNAEEAAEKDAISIWNILAPDPNFGNVPATATSAEQLLPDVASPPEFQQPPACLREPSTPASAASFTPCPSCMQKLCSSCSQKAAASSGSQRNNTFPPLYTPSPFRGGSVPSSLQIPRSALTRSDAYVEGRVLSAARKQAETMASPVGVLKKEGNVFRWCASNTEIKDSLQQALRKALRVNPSLLTARSNLMAQVCPDGYTIFMASAYANHVKAMEIIWKFVVENATPTSYEKVCTPEQILSETNLQGKTAYHIAAEKGHTEALLFIQAKHQEIFGSEADVPTDLMGHTPLGAALMSPDVKAKRNKSGLLEQLYRVTDKSVRGSPLPAEQRVVYDDESNNEASLRVVAGMSEMPGKRIRMEDCTVCQSYKSAVLIAVCDGHGDDGLVSQFVAERLVTALDEQRIIELLEYESAERWQDTCKDVCVSTDDALRFANLQGGSVAVLVVVLAKHIVVANVGDCRCILVQFKAEKVNELVDATKKMSVSETQAGAVSDSWHNIYSVKALSNDHKPNLPGEKDRVEKSGLSVMQEMVQENGQELVIHKINLSEGNRLGCSRAFGDFEYKASSNLDSEAQAVIAVPEVIVHSRCLEDAFVVVACDGVWDVMSNDDVAMFVTVRLVEYCSSTDSSVTAAILPVIGDELLVECLNRGAVDNLSVVVAALSSMADRVLGSAATSLQGKALDFASAASPTP